MRVLRDDDAAWKRLDAAFSMRVSNGWAGLIEGFQTVSATVTHRIAPAPTAAAARRRGVIAPRINAATTKPRIPREKVRKTMIQRAESVIRRNQAGSAPSRRATTVEIGRAHVCTPD